MGALNIASHYIILILSINFNINKKFKQNRLYFLLL